MVNATPSSTWIDRFAPARQGRNPAEESDTFTDLLWHLMRAALEGVLMSDLFEQVLHHIDGSETEIQNWQTQDGIKTFEFQSFGPDRWIESVHERGRMTGIECLAIILYALDESLFNPEPARRIVEGWAAELREAISTGEIHARDPVTLLALPTLPDGWEWFLSTADADKFIAARGMNWRFGEVARQLFIECEQAIQKRRFPPWTWETKQPAPVVTDGDAPGNGKVWTPEKLAELRAYRDEHGTKKAAEHFRISGARVRELLPSDKPKQKGYSAFTHRPR